MTGDRRGRPVALRLQRTAIPRAHRNDELDRIFSGPILIEPMASTSSPTEVGHQARRLQAIAVIADTFRGDVIKLVAAVDPVPVLRPVTQPRRGAYAGGLDERFACDARLNLDGELIRLADGELA